MTKRKTDKKGWLWKSVTGKFNRTSKPLDRIGRKKKGRKRRRS